MTVFKHYAIVIIISLTSYKMRIMRNFLGEIDFVQIRTRTRCRLDTTHLIKYLKLMTEKNNKLIFYLRHRFMMRDCDTQHSSGNAGVCVPGLRLF
ncbi:unnamed protein product [Vicia faba]|uniref:Uncharacterized protein n=1 Tax=Vicia faba TaxID=3906 RepID=A0AAV0ZI27_VICFA|nr:unnamed protein product [Vicia faba]